MDYFIPERIDLGIEVIHPLPNMTTRYLLPTFGAGIILHFLIGVEHALMPGNLCVDLMNLSTLLIFLIPQYPNPAAIIRKLNFKLWQIALNFFWLLPLLIHQ